jgi:2,3-diketo-5-methylthio-1-phosphopentane phosphatase
MDHAAQPAARNPRPEDAAGVPRRPQIVCDFDGTVTPFDVTDAVLERFAAPEWRRIEQDWLDGAIGAGRCMELQIGLLSVSPRALDAFLDSVPIRAGFREFADFCRRSGRRLRVVSDGLDYAITRILRRHGLGGLPVVANRLLCTPGPDADAPAAFALAFPHNAGDCPAGVCKCRAVADGGEFLLIGDGRSDCCVAGAASFTLALQGGELERRCSARGYPHVTFTDFFAIRDLLAARDAAGPPPGRKQ